MSICRRASKDPAAFPKTFWFKRISLISLVLGNDPSTTVHFTFSIVSYPCILSSFRLPESMLCPTGFPTLPLPVVQAVVGLLQMDRAAYPAIHTATSRRTLNAKSTFGFIRKLSMIFSSFSQHSFEPIFQTAVNRYVFSFCFHYIRIFRKCIPGL